MLLPSRQPREELEMPYKSEKQKKLMQAVAHNPAFAATVGIPQTVGKKYEQEDKAHHESLRTKSRASAIRRRPGSTKY